MMNFVKSITAAIALLGVVTVAPAEAAAIKVGVLECRVDNGWGLILGSSRKVDCTFTGSNGKKSHYDGKLTRVGLDIGFTDTKTLAWVVMSLEGRGADLSGTYLGVGAEATAVVGLGANVMVGGLDDNFALQPISVNGQTGLNVAGGVQSLTLR